jgi:hypothetical protein
MAPLIVLICLAAPPLLMWWMIVVQRRVRAQMRAKDRGDEMPAAAPAYVEEVRGSDGLSYGRAFDGGDALPALSDAGELDGIRALQGRR